MTLISHLSYSSNYCKMYVHKEIVFHNISCWQCIIDNVCIGQMPGTPETPTRRSVRLLAKQLYEEELMESPQLTKDTEKHLRRTPEHGRPDTELKHTASRSSARKDMDEKTASESETESAGKPDVVVTPPQMSMHSHFLDSRQLNRTDLATDAEKSPRRKSSRGSPSRREVTESVRRSPRLTAKRDNLLMESPQPTKTNVSPVGREGCREVFDLAAEAQSSS